MFKKIIIISMLIANIYGCPFDEDDNDPTVDAYIAIETAISKNDYKQAKSIAKKWAELYIYFEKTYKEPINTKLNLSIDNNNNTDIIHWLNRSIIVETKELLNLAQDKIFSYQEARIYLVKAKKHLVILEKRKLKSQAKKSKKALRAMLKSLGNPGMFGVGKKPPKPKKFTKNKKILFELLEDR